MGYLPALSKKRAKQTVTAVFKGINRAEEIADGEFARTMNLSTREYPMLCTRKPRGTVRTLTSPLGLFAKDKLCWIDGADVYWNGTKVAGLAVSTLTAMQPKRIVGFGAYILIFPDKKYFNTVDTADCGSMEASYSTQLAVSLSMCRLDGTDYGTVTAQDEAPSSPENGDYWIDTSSAPHKLMMYSETYGAWQQILTVYTRIAVSGISADIHAGDTVEISGIAANTGESDEAIKEQLAALNGSQYVYAAGEGWITVLGLLDASYTMDAGGSLQIKREVPDMEYVVESENRLWGCHYGKQTGGETLNEIYACKLGDFRNWRVYQGISTDSYTVSVGSDGPFTGAITYGGYPMFFKEGCVHKIYGAQPRNFQVMTTQMRGVKDGCAGSLVLVDGALIYESPAGIEEYDGSLPRSISENFADTIMAKGVAGAVGSKYYLSVYENSAWHLYVYDARCGVWLEETPLHALAFAPLQNELYALDADTGVMYAMLGTTGTSEGTVEWLAETGLVGWDQVQQKYVTRVNIRARIAKGARVKAHVQYNSRGQWYEKMNLVNPSDTARTLLMPVLPHRCDNLRLRLSGEGEVKVYSIASILSGGGDGQRG